MAAPAEIPPPRLRRSSRESAGDIPTVPTLSAQPSSSRLTFGLGTGEDSGMDPQHGATADKRILVVEDDAALRSALIDLLWMEGYNAVGVGDGRRALEELRQSSQPDLILLDLTLPVMDGWQFRMEQKRDPTLASIPVLVMSADDTAKAAAIDAELFLRKPVDPKKLLESVGGIMQAVDHGRAQSQRMAHSERMASLGVLASGIAHEINNPLTYVMMNMQFMGRELPDLLSARAEEAALTGNRRLAERVEAVTAALREAMEGAERIRRIVSDIRSFSRVTEERRTVLDLCTVLDSSIKIVFNEIRHRARLVREYREAPLVEANEGRLAQVFVNLLINAAQAITPGDADNNEIRVITRVLPNGYAVAEIVDSGCGMPPEVRRRIFEPFFTTKSRAEGTGLGLAVCHGIVTSMGGQVQVDSELGKGSTFRVVLPAVGDHGIIDARAEVLTTSVHPRSRLLVIDDEPTVLKAFQRMYEAQHDVVVAQSGKQALELLLTDGRFDAILCDVMMPNMTGMEFFEALQQQRPQLTPRVVFMSGAAFSDLGEFLGTVRVPLDAGHRFRRKPDTDSGEAGQGFRRCRTTFRSSRTPNPV
ncbi:MAG: response regulator, partial [Myxococcota bacterium]